MADNKSSEEMVIWECIECGHEHEYHQDDYRQDGLMCKCCDGVVNKKTHKNKHNVSELKVDIDCSDALKGLKAIQRETRKTIQVLKELEEQQKKVSTTHKKVRPCPKCDSDSISTTEFRVGEDLIHVINKCMKCEWTYNE